MFVAAKFLRGECGVAAIEHGLIAAGISVAIITTAQGSGAKLISTLPASKAL